MDIKISLTAAEHKDLVSYCNLNDLLISSVVKDSFTTGFNIERYGLLNGPTVVKEVEVIKEVVKRVEVPVEVEKEIIKIEYVEIEKPVEKIVEVIKEVPVEKIVEVIKEVTVEKVVEIKIPEIQTIYQTTEIPVEKIIYITNQQEMDEKIFQKEREFEVERQNFSTKMVEIENIFQNEKNELLSKIQQFEERGPEIVEVIKEVVVENVDKSKLDALQNTLLKLRQEILEKDKLIKEYEKTIEEVQAFNQEKRAVFLRGSNLDNTLYK